MQRNSHSLEEHFLISAKLEQFYDLLECNYTIAHWCYADDGHLISSNSPDSRILDVLFSVSNAKDYMLEYGKENTMPLIISSSLGNLWIVTLEPVENKYFYHMLGPLFTNVISKSSIAERLNAFQVPLSWKKNFEQLIATFPAVPWNILSQYTIMLHYLVTGKRISTSDFAYYGAPGSTITPSQNIPTTTQKQDTQTDNVKNESLIWNAEQTLLDNIREGNLNYHEGLSLAISSSSGVNIQADNPLRQAKDSGIVFCALCARAAIQGGLSAETAYTIQNVYSQNIEGASTVSDVANVNHQMYTDFIARVHKLKAHVSSTLPIRRCIEYIQTNIETDISVKEIADKLGYSNYYLTRKFKKELGISINQYVRQEKLKIAKRLLSSTDLSIQEISERLSFCSRSYFTEIFIKSFGETPTAYRSNNQK